MIKSTLTKLKQFNDWFAVRLSEVYANPLLIWACLIFSITGAFVSDIVLAKMTYWSNTVQLVYCPLSIYVSSLLLVKHSQTAQKHDELAKKVDAIHAHITGEAKQ